MKGNEPEVLERYDLKINSTRRVRGAVLCETDRGLFLLKELSFSEKRIPDLCHLYEYVARQGCVDVDFILKNSEGEYVSLGADEQKYVLKCWFDGRELDCRRESDILEGVRNLACVHAALQELQFDRNYERKDMENDLLRHNRELKKVRSFMRNQASKGEFEILFLKYFDAMYEWAECAANRGSVLDYASLGKQVLHGDYNYHNVIVLQNRVATTGFEHFYEGVQLQDLYYYLRKIMEKNQWNVRLGNRMIEQYHRIMPISETGFEYLATCIAYPEKFWKLANTYNRANKA